MLKIESSINPILLQESKVVKKVKKLKFFVCLFFLSSETCPTTMVTSLPFNNLTGSVGTNVTFSCEADVGMLGCEINVMFHVKRNGTIMPLSDGQYDRLELEIK